MSKKLGSYSPAFFKMKVNVDGEINLNMMAPKDFSVFFHEYIHFIQDFTTAACCRRIYVYGEFVRQCVIQITAGPKDFTVPVQVPELENNVMPNIDVMNRVEGDDEDMSVVVIKNIDTFPEKIVDKDSNNLKFETLVVTTMGDMPISVGTYAIKESMAYLVEQLCTSDHEKSPDFPYNIARLICDYMLGKNAVDDLKLLALCDVSLLTSNPGLSFYRNLCMIRDGVMVLNNPEDVYDYFYRSRSIAYDTGQEVLSITDYMQSAFLALETLKQYYALERLQDLNEWLEKVFLTGVAFRMKRPYFMIEMARGAKDKANGVLQFFAKEIGSPLIENNQGQMFKLELPGGEPPTEYLYVLQQIYNLFKKGEKACTLKPWCVIKLGEPEAPADARCDSAPWSRCRDTNLCPYALFWHHRKLSTFIPRIDG
jgi:hypothetical protein